LDADSSAVLNFSGMTALFLGAYSDPGGTPISFSGAITPNGTTYRLGSSSSLTSGPLGAIGAAVQMNTNILVMTRRNTLVGSNSLITGTGTLYMTAANSYTGGTSMSGTNTRGLLGFGNNSALGTGTVTAANTVSFIGSLNGDHVFSNNFATTVVGDIVVASDLASDGIVNPGAMTYLGTSAFRPTTQSLFVRAGMTANYLGNITGGAITLSGSGTFNFLTQAPGAVAKSEASLVIGSAAATTVVAVIDDNRSLGVATGALTLISSTLVVQPGITTPIILTRNVALASLLNAGQTFNTPGGSLVGGNSSLIIDGHFTGVGTTGQSISKVGLGTLTLRGTANSVSAPAGVFVTGGTLVLDFATYSASTMLASAQVVTLGSSTNGAFSNGGTLSIINGNAGAVTQTLGALAGTSKDNAISLTTNSSNLTLAFGAAAITHAVGGTLAFSTTSGGGTVAITSTQAADAGGLLMGGSATWNGTDYATVSNGAITAYTGYTVSLGTLVSNVASNSRIDNTTQVGDVTMAAGGVTLLNTLLVNNTAARTIDIGTGNTLRLGTIGGILPPNNTGVLTIGTATGAAGGTLSAGGSASATAGELIFLTYGNSSVTVNSVIANNVGAGAVTIVKSGSGTLFLNGSSTNTGATYINNGILEITTISNVSAANPLGQSTAAQSNLVFNGGTLRYNTASDGSTDRAAQFNTYSSIDVANSAATLAFNVGNATGIAGVAGFNGTGLMRKTGAGALTLSGIGNNTNLSVEVVNGTLNLGKTAGVINAVQGTAIASLIIQTGATARLTGASTDQIQDTSSVVVNGGGTLDLNGRSETFDGLGGVGATASVTSTTAATLTLGFSNNANISAYTLAAAAAGVPNTGLNNFAGVIGGSLSVTKMGAGTQILTGNSTYTGTTTINAGTLQLGIADALASGSGKGDVTIVGTTKVNGLTVVGTLDMGGFDQRINGLNSTTGGFVTNTPTLAFTGGAWRAAGQTTGSVTRTFSVGNGDASGAFNGILQDGVTYLPSTSSNTGVVTGLLAFEKAGTGTQALSGASTFSGGSTIKAGTVLIGISNATFGGVASGALGTSAVLLGNTSGAADASLLTNGAFTFSNAITAQDGTSGTLTLGGNSNSGSTFSGAITINQSITVAQVATTGSNALSITGGITGGTSGSKTVTFTGPGAITVSSTGISDGSGTMAVAVTNGTISFATANTYSGGTIVSGGSLAINNSTGSGTGTGNVTVNGGGTLKGTGTVGVLGTQTTIGASGILSAGDSVGTLKFNNDLSLTSGSTFAVPITSNSNYGQVQINAGGSIDLGSSTLNLIPTGYVPASGDVLFIVKNQNSSGGISGTFAGIAQGDVIPGYTNYNGSGFDLRISYNGDFDSNAFSMIGGNDVAIYATATPEPHHIMFISTAVLGMFLVIRRRWFWKGEAKASA